MSISTVTRRALGAGLFATMLALPVVAQAEPLRVGWSNIGAFEPFFIAERNGWFAEAGLEVELIEASNPQQNVARLMSGELDLVGSGAAPAIAAIAQGVPLKIVLGNQNIDTQPTVGLVVRADSPYQSVGDLEGQSIGTFGLQGTGSFLVFRALREAGFEPDAVELINMPPPTFIENLQNGNVEAIVPFALFYDLALTNPDFRLLSDAYGPMIGTPGIIYLSSEAVLAQRGDEFVTFIEVMARAYDYANAHPDEVRALDAELTQLPQAYIASRPIPPTSVTLDADQLQRLAEDMVAFGFIPSAPTPEQMLWERMPN
ncbi:ABC transporter substrate-binding protein [Nioella sp.]|uniref:ABC transporter substrate-binding protein n=1 Tax=Nioella sp. TaxID=1912091 RepID=UPI003510E474